MSYCASQMRVATEIAYMDIDSDAVTTGASIETILKMQIENGSKKEREKAQALLDFINETPGCKECLNWTVRDVGNDQRDSGMYGCMLDTQDGDAIIAFRGSESSDIVTGYKDWVEADLGLLNDDETKQQQKAKEYVEYLYKKYPEYNEFRLTGHSLGGNLAEHATITASEGMRDKISICMSLDGPGYSQKYIDEHWDEIQKSSHLIEHYQWSPVGTLLRPIPGTKYYTVEADGVSFGRHSTSNLHYDEDGNLILGERDWSSLLWAELSWGIDLYLYVKSFGLKDMVHWINSIRKEGLKVIKEKLSTLYPNNNKHKKFEIELNGLFSVSNDLESYAKNMKEFSERIEQIQKNITFSAISNAYIKMKLWDLTETVGNQGNKIHQMGNVGMEICHCYRNRESLIKNYCTL